MQKANDLPQSKLSHFKTRLNIADVRTVSVVEQHIRTVSALSVLPTYSLHNLRTFCVLSPWSLRGLRVASAARRPSSQTSSVLCPRRPYYHHTASIAICSYPRKNLGQCVHPLLHLLLPPYCLRTLYTQNFVRTLSAPISSIRAQV